MADLQTFPTKPRLKPTSKQPNRSPESKYWKSFKTHQISGLVSSITSINFSPLSPHHFAATYGASLSFFNPHHPFTPTEPLSTIHSFKDTSFSASFRSDGKLLAAGCQSGTIHVFEAKTRNNLRQLKGHTRPVRLVQYPRNDLLHLFSASDDSIVKYWDVATETSLNNLMGHKDYVRSGSPSPVDDNLFVTGSYDHTVRVWDIRGFASGSNSSAMVINHGKPVEDVQYLPSGGLIATAGGNVVKIWDVIGGGRCLYTLETHNKTVTSICVGKMGKDSGDESDQYRLLSVSLDGYFKVFDYSKLKVTFSMRFPAPLLSVGFSPDCSTRVIGTSNGIIYMGKRKEKIDEKPSIDQGFLGFQYRDEPKRVLKPSSFRYFHRGQSEKPKGGEYLILKPKKVKLAEHDKLLKKFRHKDAFVAVLQRKNPENVVAVMEELIARKKLFKCVSNLDVGELEMLLGFLQKYTTLPRYAGLLMPFASKVIQMQAEELRSNDKLKSQIRNLKRSIQEELRIQQSLLEIQGIISPLMRIAGRR
ncbi:protein SLOW WALKER 1 [Amaranthus tricolor]|uniref:protein SLOW WALKER 1 n=1 Tax=Amaranthus tricolor TaxID=29722 RepID=UPI00258B7A3B|nr:protein SLOW WALKER 1 [Amaranthus tricolor]